MNCHFQQKIDTQKGNHDYCPLIVILPILVSFSVLTFSFTLFISLGRPSLQSLSYRIFKSCLTFSVQSFSNLPQLYPSIFPKSVSQILLLVNLWTKAHQVPLSMGFSRQEYWSGLPFLSPGDLPDPGIEPRSPALQAGFFTD